MSASFVHHDARLLVAFASLALAFEPAGHLLSIDFMSVLPHLCVGAPTTSQRRRGPKYPKTKGDCQGKGL